MAVWDEQNMIALSIESTKDIVYEYIIVIKKGIDKTREVIEHCRKVWGLRMKIIESELKLREARKLCFKMAENYADYFLIQDGDEIYFTEKELKEMGRKTIMELIEENYDHCSGCMIYLKHDLRNTLEEFSWLIEHPFLVKNLPEVYWPDKGDLPYINFNWSIRKYKEFFTRNKTTPYKFDCNIKNYRRLFLRQVFTPWHDGNNTCTIEEYCLTHFKPCIDYMTNVRVTNDIEEIISYYQESDPTYRFCKLYNEEEFYKYPAVIKKYIDCGFLKGIEYIDELPIMISNSEEESRAALENKIQKQQILLESMVRRLEEIETKLKENDLEIKENYLYNLLCLFDPEQLDENNRRISLIECENYNLGVTQKDLSMRLKDIQHTLECSIRLRTTIHQHISKPIINETIIDTLDISKELEDLEKDTALDQTNFILKNSMDRLKVALEKAYAALDKAHILEYKIQFYKNRSNDIVRDVISEILYENKHITEVNELSKKIVNDAIKSVLIANTPVDVESDIDSDTLSIKSLSEIEDQIEEPIEEKNQEIIEVKEIKEDVLEGIEKDDVETTEPVDKDKFLAYCIVYSKSAKRLDNYYKCKEKIPELIYREAVDTVSKYEKHKKAALKNNLLTEAYIYSTSYYKGKLGCNLSHMYLLEDFIKNESGVNWALVLEDDVEISGYDKKKIERLIEAAIHRDSHFIQLYTNDRFIEEQKKKECIEEGLYDMIPQWGTVAYLISKTGAELIIESFPLEENIDGVYSKHISRLRSLCYLNQIFINKGDVDAEKKGEFGSIIWGNS